MLIFSCNDWNIINSTGITNTPKIVPISIPPTAPVPIDLLPAAPAPEAPAPAEFEVVEQLKQLAALKEQGILTEEEFSAKKAQLLGI